MRKALTAAIFKDWTLHVPGGRRMRLEHATFRRASTVARWLARTSGTCVRLEALS
jgi:hypothetical protein